MPENLRIIFAGTPDFAAAALQALLHTSHKIIAVFTQPDRPAGRGRKLTASPVKKLALENNLKVYQPETLKNSSIQQEIADLKADVLIVAAYGLILPAEILQAPKFGCINIHASLLPRWRGAAPIQRAILANDKKTGITIMQMDVGLDTGNMLYKAELPIEENDTAATLHDKLASLGSEALIKTLNSFDEFKTKAEQQDNTQATYAEKISKQEAEINWNEKAEHILRKIRAFNPWPVAFTQLEDETIRIWDAELIKIKDIDTNVTLPGVIIGTSTNGIDVATGKDILQIKKLQMPGGKVITSQAMLNSSNHPFKVGMQLG